MAAPRVFKKLTRTTAGLWVASAFGAAAMTFVRMTARVNRPAPPAGGPFVLAMWHSRLLMLDYLRPNGRAIATLISGHSDGQIISKMASIGSRDAIRTVTGSSSRGGTKAIRELKQYARAGRTLFITPDGPRGPSLRAQPGVVEIARLTGLPILPASVSASWYGRLGSWDRLIIPFPFTRIAVRWGEPIYVDRKADRDAVLAQLETELNACQTAADEACVANHNREQIDEPLRPALQAARDKGHRPIN
jgi:hypothetical protein